MHFGKTGGLSEWPTRDWLVSAGTDRTVRVWDINTGDSIKTIRVPMGKQEGDLFDVSVNPATGITAVGGWTARTPTNHFGIHLLDLESGEILRRIDGFSERITSLAFTPKGRHLYVAQMDGYLHKFDAKTYQHIKSDWDCKGQTHRMDIDLNGRVVTNCEDGAVRVYDNQLNLLKKINVEVDSAPGTVRFSPNGKRLAIGVMIRPEVYIYDTDNFELLATHNKDLDTSIELSELAWSKDGRTLYATADYSINRQRQLVYWSERGQGKRQTIALSEDKVFRMIRLDDGGLAYTAIGHEISVRNSDLSKRFTHRAGLISHRFKHRLFRISDDAKEIAFALDDEGNEFARFSLSEKTLFKTSNVSDLNTAVLSTKALKLSDWDFHFEPKVNDRAIPMEYQGQFAHSVAVLPDKKRFLLGADGSTSLHNKDGSVVWRQALRTLPAALNVSKDGTVFVAASLDGTIRWYRVDNGELIMSLLPFPETGEWVAWVPPGFYVSSEQADQYIGWHMNNGPDKAADYYSARQFENFLYRPALVLDYFDSRGELSKSELVKKNERSVADIRDLAPPKIAHKNLKVRGSQASFEVSLEGKALVTEQLSVYVNDIPVTPFEQRGLDVPKSILQKRITVPLLAKENVIRVEAKTGHSLGVHEFIARAKQNRTSNNKGDLYLVSIGVNELPAVPRSGLVYAAADSRDFSSYYKTFNKSAFKQVHEVVLNDLGDDLPTSQNIKKALEIFSQAGPNDTSILFIASHGGSDKNGDYFMVPRDVTEQDWKALAQNELPEQLKSLVRWTAFFDSLSKAAGKRLLVVDTCNGRNIEGSLDVAGLAKRSASAKFALMTSSKGDEKSHENPRFQHGVFTYGLLHGIEKARADKNKDGEVHLNELFDHMASIVNHFYDNQTPQFSSPKSLYSLSMSSAGN